MNILKEVDKPGSDVESYIEKLDKILLKKIIILCKIIKLSFLLFFHSILFINFQNFYILQ